MKNPKQTHSQVTSTARSLGLLIVVFCIASGASSQTSGTGQTGSSGGAAGTTAQPGARLSSSVLVSPEQDYRIGPNDVIDVQIENMPDISKTYRVTAAGTFLMSYAGRITATKKTTEELAQFIADKLRGDYLKDPRVTVAVREYNSRSFFIQGSVRSPGVYQIEGRPSVLELITLASGLSDSHGANAYIIRRIKAPSPVESHAESTPVSTSGKSTETGAQGPAEDAPKYELKSANINALLRGQFDQDVFLEPGDIVNIPPTDVFFVAGEVNQPGSFPLKEGTTLRQAISLAQGTNFKAALDKCIIFRETTGNKREEVRVDLGAVMNGKKEDVVIAGNDLIYVPNSRAKSIGGALLRAFGLSTVARVPLP